MFVAGEEGVRRMSKTWTMVLVVLGVGAGCIDLAWAAPRSALEEAADFRTLPYGLEAAA